MQNGARASDTSGTCRKRPPRGSEIVIRRRKIAREGRFVSFLLDR
jgi:hypothetical protein